MRTLYLAAAAAIVAMPALVMGVTPTKAQGAPYCLSNFDGGSTENCYFLSLQECQATASGIGASCVLNPGFAGAYAYAPGSGYGPYGRGFYRRPFVRGYVGF